ncbi:hypothetical protein FI667_g6702, partial [Globisporangium splendens]
MGTVTSSAFPTNTQENPDAQQQQIRTRRHSDDTTGSSLFDALARTVSRAAAVGIMGGGHDENRQEDGCEDVEVEVVQQLVTVATTTTTTAMATLSGTARVVEQSSVSSSRSHSADVADSTQEEGQDDDRDEQVEEQEQEQEEEESDTHEDADEDVAVISVNVEATASSSAQEEEVNGEHEVENDDDEHDEDVDAEAEEKDEGDDAGETRAPEEDDVGNDDDVEDSAETANTNDEVAKDSAQATEASLVLDESSTQEASPVAAERAKSSSVLAPPKEQGKVRMENPDEDMFDIVVKPANPVANITDDEDEEMPAESHEIDEGEGPHAMATKEVLVCKHCQREFAYASRGVARHKSECEVFQQRKVEESEAAAARKHPTGAQQGDENEDEDEKVVHNEDEDEEEETRGHENTTDESKPVAALDGDDGDDSDEGNDDDDDGESSLQDSTTTNASLADEKEAPDEAQPRTRSGQDPEFRIYYETGSKDRARKRAECHACGKSCAYAYMARHARACRKRAMALMPPPATPEPHVSTPRRASKRRLAQEESPDEDKNTPADSVEGDEVADGDTASTTTAQDVVTPQRLKRTKRDPTQSPTEKEPQGDKTPKRLHVQTSRTTPLQTKKHAVELHVLPHHPPASVAVVLEKTRVHFDTMLLDKGERLRCKYCGEEVSARLGVPDRHLQHCKEFDARHKRALKIKQQNEDESMHGSGDELSVVATEDTMGVLTWLFGSVENADAMKGNYRRSPLCVKSPVSRFQQLIRDSLCELNVSKSLEMVPVTRPMTLLMNSHGVQPRRTASAAIRSKLEAQELYNAGASLSFPAPESVRALLVTPLVKDLGVSPLVNPATHDAVLVCGRMGFHFEWQFHRSDCFVFQLKGKTRWKCESGAIRDPLGSYHPFANNTSPYDEESALKMYRTSAADRKLTLVPPAEDGDHMMQDADDDENENESSKEPLEVVAEPGCVVYMPSGTWCEADAIDDATWLEVRIASISHGELVADAIRQLLWKDEKWRQPILASHDVRSNRQHLDSLLKDLRAAVSTLCPSDLLPETLVSNNRDVSHDATGPAERNMDVDLSKHEFKSDKYIKIFKSTGLRENPLAVILGRHEIVDRRLGSDGDGGDQDSVALPHHSGSPHRKKALVKKSKRKPAVRKMNRAGDNVYIVHVQYGNTELRSRLRVQFRCNAFQSALVEWIRERDGAAFHASDLMEAAQKMPGATGASSSGKSSGAASSHHDDEATKYVLRFLCSIGYVSRVKLPSE